MGNIKIDSNNTIICQSIKEAKRDGLYGSNNNKILNTYVLLIFIILSTIITATIIIKKIRKKEIPKMMTIMAVISWIITIVIAVLNIFIL